MNRYRGFTVHGDTDISIYPGTCEFLELLDSIAAPREPGPGSVSFPGAQAGLQISPSELEHVRDLFSWRDSAQPVHVSRAPGRLDVMGGIADYSGSLVLQWPLEEACHVAVQVDQGSSAGFLRVVSLGAERADRSSAFQLDLACLFDDKTRRPISTAAAREVLRERCAGGQGWAAYIVGVLLMLAHEFSQETNLLNRSLSLLVSSAVPEGSGVSSSAALEVAVASALSCALGLHSLLHDGRKLALLCQRAENEVVGAPCGVMDQMAAALGRAHGLMALLCQPAQYQGTVDVPNDAIFWGINSGERHSVGGADYGTVRTAAFMGLKILRSSSTTAAGASSSASQETHSNDRTKSPELACQKPLPPSCLANVPLSQWVGMSGSDGLQRLCPEEMSGSQFLERYGAHIDTATRIDSASTYPVRVATAHPIGESQRVRLFAQLLLGPSSHKQRELLGELMRASHASYGACGLGSTGTDRLVRLVEEERHDAIARGELPVLHGAKITGGGSGGTVCVLATPGSAAEEALQRVLEKYSQERTMTPSVFRGSSHGAIEFGVIRLVTTQQ